MNKYNKALNYKLHCRNCSNTHVTVVSTVRANIDMF